MPQKYRQEELQKLFDLLPDELKTTILSPETGEKIRNIWQRYPLHEAELSMLAALVGDILMGLLSPSMFLKILKEKHGLDEETAEGIFREVNRFILFPVKDFLAEFYPEIRFIPGGRIETLKPTSPEAEIKKIEERREKPEEEKGEEDVYREPIE